MKVEFSHLFHEWECRCKRIETCKVENYLSKCLLTVWNLFYRRFCCQQSYRNVITIHISFKSFQYMQVYCLNEDFIEVKSGTAHSIQCIKWEKTLNWIRHILTLPLPCLHLSLFVFFTTEISINAWNTHFHSEDSLRCALNGTILWLLHLIWLREANATTIIHRHAFSELN